jgi:WD40 repeat protein
LVWNLLSPTERYPVSCGNAECFDLTPDGRILVMVCRGSIVLWDVRADREIRTIPPPKPTTSSKVNQRVRFLDKGHKVVEMTADWLDGSQPRATVWDTLTGAKVMSVAAHRTMALSLDATYPGLRFVTGSLGDVRVYDVGAEIRGEAVGHRGRVNQIAVAESGGRAFSASDDGTVIVWDIAAHRAVGTLVGHSDRVNSVDCTPNGNQVVTASKDRSLRVWNVTTLEELRRLGGANSWPNCVAFLPDGKSVFTAWTDSGLRIWDLQTGVNSVVFEPLGGFSEPTALALSGTGHRAVILREPGRGAFVQSPYQQVAVFDLKERDFCASQLYAGRSNAPIVAISSDGEAVYDAARLDVVKWGVVQGDVLANFEYTRGVVALALSRDGRRLVTATDTGTVSVWDEPTARVLAVFTLDQLPTCCCPTPEGDHLLVGDDLGQVHFFTLADDGAGP